MSLISKIKAKLLAKHESGNAVQEPVNTKLFILGEVYKLGIVHYLASQGVQVALLSTKPDEVIDKMLQEEQEARLLVLDYGRGQFARQEYTAEVLNLIEAFQDLGHVSVFSNTKGFVVLAKNRSKGLERVEIQGYTGAVGVYQALKTKNEVYTVGGATDGIVADAGDFKMEQVPLNIDKLHVNWIRDHVDIMQEIGSNEESLPGYS